MPNHNSKSAEELTKRYLDAVLKSQRSPDGAHIKSEEEEEDMESEDVVVSMTPPCSPPSRRASTASTSIARDAIKITSTPHVQQETPIDLSMKTGSCASADDTPVFSGNENDEISDDDEHEKRSSIASNERLNEISHDAATFDRDVKRIKLLGSTPLDLTTKVWMCKI